MENERKRARSRTKSNSSVFKRKKFHGNQHTSSNLSSQPNPESTQTPLTEGSTSYKSRVSQKLNFTTQSSKGATNPSSITTTTKSPIEMSPIETERSCYILIDTSVLNELLNKVSSCPECNEREISIMNNLEKKLGLACNLVMSCNRCNWSSELYSSREIEQNNAPGRNPFDINIRTIAFREIGKGYSALETFCGIMNMPAPMNVKAFNEMQLKIADANIRVSKTSMTDATEEIHQGNIQEGDSEDSVAKITVSCDGTWQKRGNSSSNGVVTVIAADTGKCLDYRVLSKHCDACSYWEH